MPSPEHREVVPAAQGCMFATSVSTCVLAVFIVVCLVVEFILGPTQFRAVYEDFDTELPTLTVWLLQTPIWLSILVGAILAAALVLKEVLIHHHGVNFVINLIVLLLLLLLEVAVIVALWLPMVDLMESVQ